MTTNNNKKKPSAARKLIPAIGMLTVSAMMLSSSTYAWFTMSREVEVQNIQMVATTPEDIQISLGKIYKDNACAAASDSDRSRDRAGASAPASDKTVRRKAGGTFRRGRSACVLREAGITNAEKCRNPREFRRFCLPKSLKYGTITESRTSGGMNYDNT